MAEDTNTDGLNTAGGAVAQTETVLQKIGDVASGLVHQALNLTTPQAVTLVGMLAGAFIPGASIAGFTIAQLTGIASGVAKQIPEAIAAFDEIETVANSGLPPTPEQVARWNAAADLAHEDFDAAAEAVIAGTAQAGASSS